MHVIDRLEKLSRYLFAQQERPPFFAMLERRGLAYAEVEKAIGADALPRAIARCTDCHARYYCGRRPARCINASIFTAALRKKALGAA